jgi:hypothetical protein
MKTLFDPAARDEVLRRLDALRPDTERQWGKMNAAQMLAHCAAATESAAGEIPSRQKLLGKLLGPMLRSGMLSDKPFRKNLPTGPSFVVRDAREFEQEKARLVAVIGRFHTGGPAKAAQSIHGLFGRLEGDQWGRVVYKHLDHHLQQFGA